MHLPSGNQTGLGRTGSVSSIALANLQAQRVDNRTNSPKPASVKVPTPPPPRDDKSKFSALGTGGPSDWEHFGGDDEVDDEYVFAKKDEKKNEPVQLDSVELPAPVPQIPLTQSPQGWPSPATHTAPLNVGSRQDTFVPTPPPATSSPAMRPPPHPPQQGFVMGDATVAPLRTSPRPVQNSQPPPTQQNFVMDSGATAAHSIPSQIREQHHTPEPQQPHPTAAGFVQHSGGWGTQTPNQTQGAWNIPPNNDHVAELKAKDEALERLQTESEKLKTDMQAEIERLKTESENAKRHAAEETKVLHDQIEEMKNATTQANSNTDAMLKEKDMMIERLKEDAEGKDHNISEREAQITDLRQQLEAEKKKEPVKPTAADLIPDINPWYVTSLERYIAMLRGEEGELEVENKKAIFKAFLKAESAIRGIEYYDAPPPAPVPDTTRSPEAEQTNRLRGTSPGSVPKPDLNVRIPAESPPDDDYDVSPGGRPVFRPKESLPPKESAPAPQQFPPEQFVPTAPIAAARDNLSESPAIQTAEVPQYKAYVPPAGVSQKEPTSPVHRQSLSFASFPAATNTPGPSKGRDEIFFGAHEPEAPKVVETPPVVDRKSSDFSIPAPLSVPISRSTSAVQPSKPAPTTSNDFSVPAPLSVPTSRSASAVPPPKAVPANSLADLLPSSIISAGHNQSVEKLRSRMAAIKTDSIDIATLTKTWEKSASLTRRKNDNARRARQEESEERNEELFNNNEISYAEIAQWEADQKEKEGVLKAQEDRDEYKSYVETVFDPVYDGLQVDIKSLHDLYIEAESLLPDSVAGLKSLQDGNMPSTKSCLELLIEMHEQIEKRHEKVVFTVSERDKRYKKTEIQPLYAAGNIAKMKKVEKHFEEAEKQAVLRAKREKGERVGELVHMAEDIVVGAVGVEQNEIDRILDAIKALEDGKGDVEMLNLAQIVLLDLKSSSKLLLELFNKLEIELNDSVIDAEIAEARASAADAAKIQELEAEKVAGAKKMTDEYERRVTVLDQDNDEIDSLITSKIGGGPGGGGAAAKVELTEEQEKERRLKTALEEAKRRNGHI